MYKRPVVQEIVFYFPNPVDQLETVAVKDFGKFNNEACWHFASDGFGLCLNEITRNWHKFVSTLQSVELCCLQTRSIRLHIDVDARETSIHENVN